MVGWGSSFQLCDGWIDAVGGGALEKNTCERGPSWHLCNSETSPWVAPDPEGVIKLWAWVCVCMMDGWIDVRVYIPSVVCMNSLKKKYYDKWMRNNQNEEFTNKLQSNLLHFALLFLLRLYVFYSFFAHWNWAKTLLDESMTLFCCFSVISRGTHHENSQPS